MDLTKVLCKPIKYSTWKLVTDKRQFSWHEVLKKEKTTQQPQCFWFPFNQKTKQNPSESTVSSLAVSAFVIRLWMSWTTKGHLTSSLITNCKQEYKKTLILLTSPTPVLRKIDYRSDKASFLLTMHWITVLSQFQETSFQTEMPFL